MDDFVPIAHERRARQLIDFRGVQFGRNLWPTDIDALVEWRDRGWLLYEVKHRNKDVPDGQRLALERFVRDAWRAGKQACAAVVEHKVDDPDQPVTLADCMVREVYVNDEPDWRPPRVPITAKQLADAFIGRLEHIRRPNK